MNKTELNARIKEMSNNSWEDKEFFDLKYSNSRYVTVTEDVTDEEGTYQVERQVVRAVYTIENPNAVVKELHSQWVKQVGAKTDCVDKNGKLLFFMPSKNFDIMLDEGYVCFDDEGSIIFAVDRELQKIDELTMSSASNEYERKALAEVNAQEKIARARELKAQAKASRLKRRATKVEEPQVEAKATDSPELDS